MRKLEQHLLTVADPAAPLVQAATVVEWSMFGIKRQQIAR